MDLPNCVTEWTTAHVKEWLVANRFSSYASLLCDIHHVDGIVLLTLTEDDLRNPPLNIQILGDLKKLALKINQLKQKHNAEYSDFSSCYNEGVGTKAANEEQNNYSRENTCSNSFKNNDYHVSNSNYFVTRRERSYSPDSVMSSSLVEDIHFGSPADGSPTATGMATHLEPEIWKTLLSITYFVTVTVVTSLVMVIVHDRVPDMKKYPPLPDIFLDNVPLIPWAFHMCEVTGCLLSFIWIVVLIFHKHRFILMRRFFALSGSVFLLRCVTMIITSLSVPGAHLECSPRAYGDMWAKVEKALIIWQGFGMSVRGVRTCGDYMFSGHTVVLTMLNFFITEYTSRRLYFLHTLSWILNMFGIFFILAAHEHYSIDVFIAFYITSRLFLYYHTLANSRTLRQRDRHRAKIWFPLFSFFEARIDGMVPNEYQLPWENLTLTPLYNYVCSCLAGLPYLSKNSSSTKKKAKKK